MTASQQAQPLQPFDRFAIRQIDRMDLTSALQAGLADFRKSPLLSLTFGLACALFGLVFVTGLTVFNQIWMIVPAGVGFPLVAPFLAAGLYEMSRLYERGENFTWGQIFATVFRQQRREFGWMAFVMLFIFWVWIYQVRLMLALFLQWSSFSSFEGFLLTVTSTSDGLLFLAVGSLSGAILATVLFSVTVVAMPLLLDKEVDFVSAMLLSIKSVAANWSVMIVWGIFIAVATFLAMLPILAGVIVVLPILGHATWHLYRRVLIPREELSAQ